MLSWEELCAYLATPHPADTPKKRLSMWSPATFRGDARLGANVEQVCALVFDVDEAPVPSLSDLRTVLAGKTWFAHSSSSSTAAAPRWRLVLAVSRPMTAEEHAVAWRVVTERLPFPVGAASKDSSRAWYDPRSSDSDGSFFTSNERTV